MKIFTYSKDIIKTTIKLLIGRGIFKSYAQCGEDVLISQFIDRKSKGFYVDVGAFHPVQYSNTFFLYRRGWKGLAIDPNPRTEALFKVFRPRDVFVGCAVGAKAGNGEYLSLSDPAYNTLNKDQAEEWKSRGVKQVGTYTVPIRTLVEIVAAYKIEKIDVMSVDVEGFDLEVLRSHNWNVAPEIIVAESHNFSITEPMKNNIYAFLTGKNYELVSMSSFSFVFKLKKS